MKKEDEIMLTKHGRERIRERIGVGKSEEKINRAAQKAFERGTKYSEVKGTLRRYLDRMYELHGDGDNVRIHAGNLWIFEGTKLITVKNIPARYQRKYHIYKKANKEATDDFGEGEE